MKQKLRLGDCYALAKHKPCLNSPSLALPSVPIRMCPAYISLKRPVSGILAKEERLYSDRKAYTERCGKGQDHVGAGQGSASELILYSDYPRIAQHLAGPNGGQSEYSSSTVVVHTELRSYPEEISSRRPGQRLDSGSAIVRNWFAFGQAIVWHLFDFASIFSRSVAEGLSKASRTLVGALSRDCRTSLEQQSNNGRRNIEELCVCTHAKVPARYGLGLALGLVVLLLVGNVKYTIAQESFSVSGRVISAADGTAIEGATIINKRTGIHSVTDRAGEYHILVTPDDILSYSHVGYITAEERVNGRKQITIALDSVERMLEEVNVVSTGYQAIPKERATGSFVHIDNELLNRRVSTDILSRIDGITSGLIFNRASTNYSGGREPMISIRGRSTINASAEPLIILDNFPYDGDIASVNPNDVASITVLRDAAAASVWGARSGNGVIVITTKSGSSQQRPVITASAIGTSGARPNLRYTPQLTSREYIEVERFLFDKGFYDTRLSNIYQGVSPVIEVLAGMRSGSISATDGEELLQGLQNQDIRNQQRLYLYRRSFDQQYNVNIAGGNLVSRYYASAGYDKNSANQVGTDLERYTFNVRNNVRVLNDRLGIANQILFSVVSGRRPSTNYLPTYPYERIATDKATPLEVMPYNGLKPEYQMSVGNGELLDWQYSPLLEDRLHRIDERKSNVRINTNMDYRVIKGLIASVYYQYSQESGERFNLADQNAFYTRNLVNTYTQLLADGGVSSRPIPWGNILRRSDNISRGHYGRVQLDFNTRLFSGGHFSAFTAVELKSERSDGLNSLFYGFDPETATHTAVDLLTSFRRLPVGSARIEDGSSQFFNVDRFRSVLANVSYVWRGRYTMYASARRDESNLFGVKTNQKGVPLWSLGIAWLLSDELFYHSDLLPLIKLRGSVGRMGNVDRSVAAYLTAVYRNSSNFWGNRYAEIAAPPNPSLRWEKVNSWNIGADISSKNEIVTLTVEWFRKKGNDLIGNTPIAPQTGLVAFRGNSASVRTNGMDVTLAAKWGGDRLQWKTDFLYSQVRDRITDYQTLQTTNLDYMRTNYLNPFQGYPFSALFSLAYAGVDHDGNPQGYVDGELTTDYTALTTQTGIENMVFHGSQTPTHFGSLRNTMKMGSFTCSFNITYKLGYYFRRIGLNNSLLYRAFPSFTMPDYGQRWQKPGDEHNTDVPSMIYPANTRRTEFYQYSSALVERADHIRIQDIQLSYRFTLGYHRQRPLDLDVFAYTNHLGVLWRKSKYAIDPDVPQQSGFQNPTTVSVGFTAKF